MKIQYLQKPTKTFPQLKIKKVFCFELSLRTCVLLVAERLDGVADLADALSGAKVDQLDLHGADGCHHHVVRLHIQVAVPSPVQVLQAVQDLDPTHQYCKQKNQIKYWTIVQILL